MRPRRLLLFAALLLWLVPCKAAAQFYTETVQITAAGATSDQSSALIYPELWADGLIVIVDVTAPASGLLLDVDLYYWSASMNAFTLWSPNLPSNQGITGESTTFVTIIPDGLYTHYAIAERVAGLPPSFKILVDHGNATAATYTVRTQWLNSTPQ